MNGHGHEFSVLSRESADAPLSRDILFRREVARTSTVADGSAAFALTSCTNERPCLPQPVLLGEKRKKRTLRARTAGVPREDRQAGRQRTRQRQSAKHSGKHSGAANAHIENGGERASERWRTRRELCRASEHGGGSGGGSERISQNGGRTLPRKETAVKTSLQRAEDDENMYETARRSVPLELWTTSWRRRTNVRFGAAASWRPPSTLVCLSPTFLALQPCNLRPRSMCLCAALQV